MTYRITVAMQKGGVGKSTTTINLAGALNDRGHDVLVVDADPQGGATLKMGLREEYRTGDHALFDVLSDMGTLSYDDLNELIVSTGEFDMVPSHLKNFNLEKYLYSEAGGHEALRKAVDRLDADYDIILIDSPPNLGPLSDGSLIASENVLFPSHPNTIARDSLEILFDEIETIEDKFDQYDIKTMGAVLNEVPSQGNVAREVEDWFSENFGEDYVFKIPDRDVVEHAIEYRTTIYQYDPEEAGYPWDADAKEDIMASYDQIADYVEGFL
ncbi:ParA family protein [Halapricum sp. CBA1109]|uniref:ParA family protein n=1 Tax=Halapricum sp. CBA1109 TaxID=2668068 RepID=UPI002103A36A|nr:ParA family protein [Halapricum sp. CBA1109]